MEQHPRDIWTVEERLAYRDYVLDPLEMALVKLYAKARFIEVEGYLPPDDYYRGKEVRHIDMAFDQMWEGKDERDRRQVLRERRA
jgi:hypothetical protein